MLPIVAQETMRPSQCGGSWMIPPRRTRRKYGNEMPRWALGEANPHSSPHGGHTKGLREMYGNVFPNLNLSRNTSKCQGSSSFSK